MTREPIHDLAHIGHAELLTPYPDDSLRFFVDLFGMEIEHREGQSVFLRGWGEYQPYGLKLTESALPGLGHTAIRAWRPEALRRRVSAIEQTGYGILAFISNHGYLDNPTFRGMRCSLMDTFDNIYVLDLHGNSKKKERAPDGNKDENVFDIQQGVAIGIFVRRASSQTGSASEAARDISPRSSGGTRLVFSCSRRAYRTRLASSES